MKNEVVPPPVGQACSIIHGAAILGFTRLVSCYFRIQM